MYLALLLLAACAGEKLAPAPASGVDLSGHWKLNEADSDDAQRLMQAQLANATAAAGPAGSTRRGGGGSRGGAAGGPPGAFAGPVGPQMPPVPILDDGLRWPGKDLTIQQTGAVVTFNADAASRVCRPGGAPPSHHHGSDGADSNHGRDRPAYGRGDVPPPVCGWEESTLIVRSGDPEDEHPPFEQRFSLAPDGQRLIEVVMFTGGRSSGFTASRVWDRQP
jgi:hypothetical protein